MENAFYLIELGRFVIKFVKTEIAFDHRVPSCKQYIFNGHIDIAYKGGPYDQRLISVFTNFMTNLPNSMI
jgi:hypothetical protein